MAFIATSVQDTIKVLMIKGLNFPDALREIEHKLRTKLDEDTITRIKETLDYLP